MRASRRPRPAFHRLRGRPTSSGPAAPLTTPCGDVGGPGLAQRPTKRFVDFGDGVTDGAREAGAGRPQRRCRAPPDRRPHRHRRLDSWSPTAAPGAPGSTNGLAGEALPPPPAGTLSTARRRRAGGRAAEPARPLGHPGVAGSAVASSRRPRLQSSSRSRTRVVTRLRRPPPAPGDRDRRGACQTPARRPASPWKAWAETSTTKAIDRDRRSRSVLETAPAR